MKSLAWIGAFLALSAISASVLPNAFGPSAFGDDTPEGTRTRAITITTDAFAGNFAIDVVRDSTGAMTEMMYQTPANPNGVLTLDQLRQGPQVTYNTEGHDVILLSLESDFDPAKGGHAIVRYLHNGATGSYKDLRVLISVGSSIVLTTDPDPSDSDSDGVTIDGPFNHLYMEKNTFLGMVIGIDNVVPSYQGS